MTMTEVLAKKTTPTAAFRAVMAPYRDKLERSDAARGKLEGRLRRAFDLFDAEMRETWGDPESAPTNGADVTAPVEPTV
jgi:hypothetical protein